MKAYEEIQIPLGATDKKSDSQIASAVLNALKCHSAVPEDKLRIEVENGIVTMEGELEWEFQKTSARNAVINLLGVRGLNNYIKIVPKVVSPLSVSVVKANIIKALHRRASEDAGEIEIETIGNKVILTGTVHSLSEKDDVGSAVRSVPGVMWVENNIEIDSEVLVF